MTSLHQEGTPVTRETPVHTRVIDASVRWWHHAQSGYRFARSVARQEKSLLHRGLFTTSDERMLRWHTDGFTRKKAFGQALRDPSLIYPRVYLGSCFNASNADTLRRKNIKAIVNVAVEVDNYFSDIQYCNIPLRDEVGQRAQREQCEQVLQFVQEHLDTSLYTDDRCVLIHCVFGLSRSVAMAAHVKMALEQRSEFELWDTIASIQSVRPLLAINVDLLPDPHGHFMRETHRQQQQQPIVLETAEPGSTNLHPIDV